MPFHSCSIENGTTMVHMHMRFRNRFKYPLKTYDQSDCTCGMYGKHMCFQCIISSTFNQKINNVRLSSHDYESQALALKLSWHKNSTVFRISSLAFSFRSSSEIWPSCHWDIIATWSCLHQYSIFRHYVYHTKTDWMKLSSRQACFSLLFSSKGGKIVLVFRAIGQSLKLIMIAHTLIKIVTFSSQMWWLVIEHPIYHKGLELW